MKSLAALIFLIGRYGGRPPTSSQPHKDSLFSSSSSNCEEDVPVLRLHTAAGCCRRAGGTPTDDNCLPAAGLCTWLLAMSTKGWRTQRKQLRLLFVCVTKRKRKRLSQWRASIHGQAHVFGTTVSSASTQGNESWDLLLCWAMTPPPASASPQVAGQPLPELSAAESGSQPLCASVSRGQCSYK